MAITLSGDGIARANLAADVIDGTKIEDDAVGTEHLANAINTDIAAKLPLAGGTMTGHLDFGDAIEARLGASQDLIIKHDGSNSIIADNGTGDLYLTSNLAAVRIEGKQGEDGIVVTGDGSVELYENDVKKLETTAQGIQITGRALATTDTDTSNSGNVSLNFEANQNFVLTLTGNVTLTNPSFSASWPHGQSGFITFIQDGTGSRTVSLGTDYETAAGGGLTLTSTASATDIVPYVVVATNRILLGTPQLAFS
jgi:hypothetical protein